MVIDAAKGIEARTRKLFEICRLRDIPIITFINKMDRETREPLELLDEIEKTLALDTAPMVWPVGRGRDFKGTYDLLSPRLRQLDEDAEGQALSGADDPIIDTLMEPDAAAHWREEIGLVSEACGKFDLEAFREGTLTPVYFGSALRNYGVRALIDSLISFAPPPRSQKASGRTIEATEPHMTGIVFKIQANMDPNHRDRIAFMRVCSGKLTRGMKAKVVRTGKTMALAAPQFFFAQDRSLAEEAFCRRRRGHSQPRRAAHRGRRDGGRGCHLPRHPELCAGDHAPHPPARCHSRQEAARGLEGDGGGGRRPALQPIDGTQPIVGVIGALQLDVLADRLTHEYGLQSASIPRRAAPCVGSARDASGPAGLHRHAPLHGGDGPRRRARVPGGLSVRPELGAGTQPRHHLHRHQDDGCEGQRETMGGSQRRIGNRQLQMGSK